MDVKIGRKKYWYRTYRISKNTDRKLKQVKKQMNKNWNGVFIDLIETFNQLNLKI